jgi:hypothetical protein
MSDRFEAPWPGGAYHGFSDAPPPRAGGGLSRGPAVSCKLEVLDHAAKAAAASYVAPPSPPPQPPAAAVAEPAAADPCDGARTRADRLMCSEPLKTDSSFPFK